MTLSVLIAARKMISLGVYTCLEDGPRWAVLYVYMYTNDKLEKCFEVEVLSPKSNLSWNQN